jgi:transposase-like protein
MAQHFLLTREARTLSLRSVFSMSEDRAYAKFKRIRWAATKGRPICPKCGSEKHWELIAGRKWKCSVAKCRTQYSVTSGTIFASRKLEFRKILEAVAIFTNGALGVAALRLQRDIRVEYKTAWVLAHKLREAMGIDHRDAYDELDGVIEVDGAVFGGKPKRIANDPDNWEGLRAASKAEQLAKKRLIVVVREREDEGRDRPARVRTFHVSKESDAVPIMRKLVKKGSVVHADEANQYDALHGYFDTKRINHSKSYSDGIACTNQAESFFSRMRRAERGVYNSIGRGYTSYYAREMAWREENRRRPNGDLFAMILSSALASPVSRRMKGYWQRRKSDNDNDPDKAELIRVFKLSR